MKPENKTVIINVVDADICKKPQRKLRCFVPRALKKFVSPQRTFV
ncbi:MAG: hypothetical protein OJF48_001229 [Afipia sp.]|nr:MAG: hypothetical protein OJF48_001229 [Afipia sp.]